jgi:hypothetical protein
VKTLKDASIVLLIIAAAFALVLTTPGAQKHPIVLMFLSLPLALQVSLVVTLLICISYVGILIVRFASQDWSGAKIRYEERHRQELNK